MPRRSSSTPAAVQVPPPRGGESAATIIPRDPRVCLRAADGSMPPAYRPMQCGCVHCHAEHYCPACLADGACVPRTVVRGTIFPDRARCRLHQRLDEIASPGGAG